MDDLLPLYVFVALVGLLVVVACRPRPDPEQLKRLRRIEHRLQSVMDHLGVAEQPTEFPEVVRLLEEGKKIHAIKAYRQTTGADLATSKNEVEAIARQRGL